METGRFRIEPRLIHVLGAQYHSSEDAIKELVANAWDADARHVSIALPDPLSDGDLVVEDDGYGMTPREIEEYYLRVAYDRRQRGETTAGGRVVRGFRGIGKFAGLTAADEMTLCTRSRGRRCTIRVTREQLDGLDTDLAGFSVPIETEASADDAERGTTVTLSKLWQTFAFPEAGKLGRVLLREFGRADEFRITINGAPLDDGVLDGARSTIPLDGVRPGFVEARVVGNQCRAGGGCVQPPLGARQGRRGERRTRRAATSAASGGPRAARLRREGPQAPSLASAFGRSARHQPARCVAAARWWAASTSAGGSVPSSPCRRRWLNRST
ncbi:MAG TPA: ATP-binding protein [Chloroflexota bacterium]|nr:ATP-binding protein [Chloroflexota bacterium]